MVSCEKCNKEFKYPWMLRRHMARKIPCKILAATENESSRTENESSWTENESSRTENESLGCETESLLSQFKNSEHAVTNQNLCQYCNKSFSRVNNKNVHEKTCSMKQDDIAVLEHKCNVQTVIHLDSTKCKYCNYNFSSKRNLKRHLTTCEKKKLYKSYLENKLKQNQPQTINQTITNNNCTINNTTININVLGQESLEHITMQKIHSILRNIILNKYPGDNNLYKLSAETVADVHKLIRENEANHNIVIPHERRQIALVKRSLQSGFVKDDISCVLDDGFRNTSAQLCNYMKDMSDAKKTKKIHKCVESFSRKGFKGHPEMPRNSAGYVHRRIDLNHAQRRFKLANMYIPNSNNKNTET